MVLILPKIFQITMILNVLLPSCRSFTSFTFRRLSTSPSKLIPTPISTPASASTSSATIRQRYPILPSMATQYTINDDVCPPIDEAELKKIVQKHCKSLNRFVDNKPIALHTKAAFDKIYPHVDPTKKVILDSGCGTARSTRLLGELYPDHTIIGIDRSFVRLNQNTASKEGEIMKERENNYGDDNEDGDDEESKQSFQAVSSNVLLVRAELTDFWRCCLNTEWDITHHFILYPNPYPKKNRLKRRFYAHPSFPIILKIGGEITLRSNWEGYLKEFAMSVESANDYYGSSDVEGEENYALPYLEDAKAGPVERVDKSVAFTNFEKKYDNVGEKTFELKLRVK